VTDKVTALERFRDATAEFALGGPPQAVIDAAVGLLESGVDDEAVVAVAGDDRADRVEVARDLIRAESALGIVPWTREDAAQFVVRRAAERFDAGHIDAQGFHDRLSRGWRRLQDPESESSIEIVRLM